MATQIKVVDRFKNDKGSVLVHETEYPDMHARIAITLIEKWGMVSAVQDGEDSAGRAKLRVATPDEVVDRACQTAAKAMEAFRERGWLVNGPDISEIVREDGLA